MRIGPAGLIKAILGLQLGIGAVLVGGDMSQGWQGLAIAPDAPGIDAPVRPGDQTRRYRPDARPRKVPGRPFPGTDDVPPRLVVEDDDRDGAPVLRLVGTIAPGDAARVIDALDARRGGDDPLPPLYLHSPGGSVTDALELGRYLRGVSASVGVAAGDLCLSACPYLLAGGTVRRADVDATVGVHQHYFGENTVQPAFMAVEDIQRGQGLVMAYLDEMGIGLGVMQPALMTPPGQIYVLMPEELSEYALVTDE